MQPDPQQKQRHVRNNEKLELKTNTPLWGFVFILIAAVFAYKLYDRYYGHQQLGTQLEAGILGR